MATGQTMPPPSAREGGGALVPGLRRVLGRRPTNPLASEGAFVTSEEGRERCGGGVSRGDSECQVGSASGHAPAAALHLGSSCWRDSRGGGAPGQPPPARARQGRWPGTPAAGAGSILGRNSGAVSGSGGVVRDRAESQPASSCRHGLLLLSGRSNWAGPERPVRVSGVVVTDVAASPGLCQRALCALAL